jgi:hypothetical protein
MTEKPMIKIPLTPEQKEQIEKQTGKKVATLRLQALEGRSAPALMSN